MARNSSRQFRARAAHAVARDQGRCGICGHGGAITADHIISYRDWPKDSQGLPLPGLDDLDNLRAAHGTRGSAQHNPCMECDPQRWPYGRMCNQSRGARNVVAQRETPHEPHSQDW